MITWQPIETAPKDGTYIVISYLSPYTTHDGGTDWERCYTVSQWWHQWTNINHAEGINNKETPTHWIPLPDHPA